MVSRKRLLVSATLGLALSLSPGPTWAQAPASPAVPAAGAGDPAALPDPGQAPPAEEPAAPPVEAADAAGVDPGAPAPRLHHGPVSTAPPGEPLEIQADIERPHLVKSAAVIYRTAQGALKTAPFMRSVAGGYTAVIPEQALKAPGLSYAIELERVDGVRVAVFASRAAMHTVAVTEDRMDARERALFERLSGRRSVVTVSTEYVRFGTTTGVRAIPCATGQKICQPGEMVRPQVDDQFWRVEAGYTYRPLRTIAEFSLRGGVVRGKSLVGLSELDEEKYSVGLNYGAPTVRFRFADAWHLEVELLTSITEIGFSVGGGSALMIGDPYGSKLTLGFETIGLDSATYFGSRFYSRMDIAAAEGLTITPVIEVTDMPHADAFGVRLLGEAAFAIGGGFTAGVRGGYQARKSTSGGASLGATLSLAF